MPDNDQPSVVPGRRTDRRIGIVGMVIGLIALVVGLSSVSTGFGDFADRFFTSAGFGGLAALAAAVIAYRAAFTRLQHDREEAAQDRLKERADKDDERRGEWWIRFQWATDQAIAGSPEKAAVGVALLKALETSPNAQNEERKAMSAVMSTVLNPVTEAASNAPWGNDWDGWKSVILTSISSSDPARRASALDLLEGTLNRDLTPGQRKQLADLLVEATSAHHGTLDPP